MAEDGDQRIRQLVGSAAQALASGQPHEAERLLREAEALAPGHPLVLNEAGKRRLLAGDPAGALKVFEAALKDAPATAELWLNLATALRDLGRSAEELAALQKALTL